MAWNPQQYLKFGGQRLRPAHDLIARVPLESPQTIIDLGCGTGTVTTLLRARWPQAHITGVDNSHAMLERARVAVPDVDWQLADLAEWAPAAPVDLLVSNAALHWLDDHATLFARLISHLAAGGVLAAQMPAQHDAPSHQIGYALAESARWRGRLQGLVRRQPILEADAYYAILRSHVTSLDLWSTEYVQVLTGDNPVAEFTKGSFVGVWLSALTDDEAQEFERDYRQAIAKAYPRDSNGVTLFPFRRFFLVAQR
ncbi:MAG: methyltransferase domain-containing protein [Betaproteobacteria bacterium]